MKILYKQAQPMEGKSLNVGHSPGIWVTHIERAFGKFPVTLTADHLDCLRGMEATWANTEANPYTELIRAVKRWGALEVWRTYDGQDQTD